MSAEIADPSSNEISSARFPLGVPKELQTLSMEGHPSSPSCSTTGGEKRTHRVFNPYEFLGSQKAPRSHRLIYDLPTSPQYVFEDEAASRYRPWIINLQLCTGAGYLAGASVGFAKGAVAGIRAAEPGESLKLRTSRVLSAGGQAWRSYGNTLGMICLVFSGLESSLMHWTGVEGDEGYLSTVAAGIGTGMVYKSAKGLRSAAIAGVIGGLAAGASVVGKQVMDRYMPWDRFSVCESQGCRPKTLWG